MKKGYDIMQPQWIETAHHKATYEAFDYVPGVTASGRFAFISGQVGVEEDGSVSDDAATQIARAFANLEEIVKAIPASPRDVVEIATYHVGLREYMSLVSTEKKKFFGDWNPAWTAIGITELAIEGLILEIRAVVLLPSIT
ncbi:RidA family protein [Chroococcidiopsis sp. FACHB-1243]|uniref:Rid family hydrolase n=1 Tax=Chroococcidiopsis sp. [FACHB-1243] TaxID=2692781 RepID=UPI00177ACD6D|nr:Rid family hydrolase [Chroococcidiopsis sp. [FACHB-1243]]MBD2309968.1 RidA family protein [Chroococcidiopsis sp. [FACHB-1243]]